MSSISTHLKHHSSTPTSPRRTSIPPISPTRLDSLAQSKAKILQPASHYQFHSFTAFTIKRKFYRICQAANFAHDIYIHVATKAAMLCKQKPILALTGASHANKRTGKTSFEINNLKGENEVYAET